MQGHRFIGRSGDLVDVQYNPINMKTLLVFLLLLRHRICQVRRSFSSFFVIHRSDFVTMIYFIAQTCCLFDQSIFFLYMMVSFALHCAFTSLINSQLFSFRCSIVSSTLDTLSTCCITALGSYLHAWQLHTPMIIFGCSPTYS